MSEQQTSIIKANGRGLQLASFGDYISFAKTVVESGLAPKALNTPQKVLVAVQTGAELGLSPMQAMRSVGVINGTPTIYGDAALALVRGSGLLEFIEETIEGELRMDLSKVEGSVQAVCRVKRKGDPNIVERSFKVAEAKLARLWGKSGPWSTHPQRMLKYKARAFALRDVFPDVLLSVHTYEELVGEEVHHVDSIDVDAAVSSRALLTGDTDDVPAEGQQVQPVQERQAAPGSTRPGLQGRGDDPGDGGLGGCVDTEKREVGDDVHELQGAAEGQQERPAGDGNAAGTGRRDPVLSYGAYGCGSCKRTFTEPATNDEGDRQYCPFCGTGKPFVTAEYEGDDILTLAESGDPVEMSEQAAAAEHDLPEEQADDKWQCDKGHVFAAAERRASSRNPNGLCPRCLSKNIKPVEDAAQAA